ncbi:hypothetical protein DRN86_01110 [Candidatus Geothermarchaeota archaeon]|nr:MAG: hypothetical protein DRN86_01110 [Candidatus Geothermarchaeota archaeon]
MLLSAALLADLILGLGLFAVIILTVYVTKRFKNAWVNRKIIHLSTVPAVIAYMYFFKEPYVFFSFSIFFTVMLILPHLRGSELRWFQIKDNYGEVFYCISFAILSMAMWNLDRVFAGLVMLFMAVGDSVTGLIRSRFLKRRGKHWTGTVVMFLVCSLIGFYFLSYDGILLALAATLAEGQPWLDDNLSVPLITTLMGLFLRLY